MVVVSIWKRKRATMLGLVIHPDPAQSAAIKGRNACGRIEAISVKTISRKPYHVSKPSTEATGTVLTRERVVCELTPPHDRVSSVMDMRAKISSRYRLRIKHPVHMCGETPP